MHLPWSEGPPYSETETRVQLLGAGAADVHAWGPFICPGDAGGEQDLAIQHGGPGIYICIVNLFQIFLQMIQSSSGHFGLIAQLEENVGVCP